MDNLDDLIEQIAGTVEVMGQQASSTAIAIMAEDLGDYPPHDVSTALARVRRECQRFSLAAVIERLPNGWPGPEEAWAAFPKDERETGVVTQEAMQAWAVALPLWEYGDKIGARMAFREAYQKAVSQADNKVPTWVPSLGYDREGREVPLRKAIEQGKLCADTVSHFLPAPVDDCGPIVGLLTGKVSAIPQDNKTKARLAELRAMITKKKNPPQRVTITEAEEQAAREKMRGLA